MKSRKFVDTVTLYARGGKGGDGCVSFRRERYVPRGGPDGGDGGRGGHVLLRVDPDEDSLIRTYFSPHQVGENGEHGKGKQLHGRNGKDVVVQVPPGTQVRDAQSGELLVDLLAPGEELVAARGGRGGLGNPHWKSPTHQAPREHTDGEPGEEATLRLELKLVADAGLVGFPNAGKSSLLTRISDAHPKIGAYPFTTLNPIIGTIVYEDYARLKVADVPGIIRGAHAGTGLGHLFLRHIERAELLVFVVDMAAVDQRSPVEDYETLRQELALHQQSLMERPSLVVANKMDLPEAAGNLELFREQTGVDPLPVSAETGAGIADLREAIRQRFPRELTA